MGCGVSSGDRQEFHRERDPHPGIRAGVLRDAHLHAPDCRRGTALRRRCTAASATESVGPADAIAAGTERADNAVTRRVVTRAATLVATRTRHRRPADGDHPLVSTKLAGAAALGDGAVVRDGHARPILAPLLTGVARAAGPIGLSLARIAGWYCRAATSCILDQPGAAALLGLDFLPC